MYALYYDKNKYELKLSVANKWQQRELVEIVTDVPYYYNDNYTLCKDRKVLKQLAIEIKNSWLAEAQLLVQKIEAIKI